MKSPEYFIHGTSSDVDAERIKEEGFVAKEGRATVSTDLVMAFRWASDVGKREASKSETAIKEDDKGRIIIMKPTDDQTVDYGKNTSVSVDKDEKKVSGYISRYQSNRRYLALYEDLNDKDKVLVPPENILISIVPSEKLSDIIFNLKSQVDSFEKVDIDSIVSELVDSIESDERNTFGPEVNIREIIENLVISTIENELMGIVRKYSIRVKRALGYTIENKMQDTRTELIEDKNELLKKLEGYKAKIDAGGVDMGFEHLNRYLKVSINTLIAEIVA